MNLVIGAGLPYTFEQYLSLTNRQKDLLIDEANKARR